MRRTMLLSAAVLLFACGQVQGEDDKARYVVPSELEARVKSGELTDAVFAGGCFWCMEGPFEKMNGVVAAVSGYSGGTTVDPLYYDVGTGRTGHTEAVRVIYDPKKVTFDQLVAVFWKNIDPLQANGQFCDLGPEYRSALFFGNDAEKATAERTRDALAEKFGKTIATELLPRSPFYAAEIYHQDFYLTNPEHYQRYRRGCGRDDRLRELWGK